MKVLKIKNKEGFTDDLQNMYIQHDFGSYNKTELEELIIELLMRHSNFADMSYFERSICLHIPESRVRSTMFRSQLKYQEYDDKQIRLKLFGLLWQGAYSVEHSDKKKIDVVTITIDDQYLKQAVEGKLKEKFETYDGSFLKENLVISKDSLILLISEYFDKEEQKLALNVFKEKKRKQKYNTLSELLGSFLTHGTLKETIQELGGALVKGLSEDTKDILGVMGILKSKM